MADNRTYNARVTTEALEKKFRDTFPSQAGAELVDDLYASGVIVPIVDFTSAAQGSELSETLQTALDFATDHQFTRNTTDVLITNTGFWLIRYYAYGAPGTITGRTNQITITDGATTKILYSMDDQSTSTAAPAEDSGQMIVFLRPGDSVSQTSSSNAVAISSVYRQIATVNGTLVNPLGFTFS